MQHTNPSKNQNCWYFIRPKQKKRLSKNRTQSMHPNQMGALINRKIKNVDISLDRSKKTILQKVCTLKMFGLHAFARGDQTSIVEKPLVRRARLKVTQMTTEGLNKTQWIFITLGCSGAKEGYIGTVVSSCSCWLLHIESNSKQMVMWFLFWLSSGDEKLTRPQFTGRIDWHCPGNNPARIYQTYGPSRCWNRCWADLAIGTWTQPSG